MAHTVSTNSASTRSHSADRRSRPRYDLDLELRFSYEHGARRFPGAGRTRNFSDRVICFETDQELPRGVQLDVCVQWPASLQGRLPLEMVIHGVLIRKQSSLAVFRMEDYGLRTWGSGSFHPAAARTGQVCDVLG